METIEEGIALRKAGIKEEILLLSQTAIKEDIENLVENNIICDIGTKDIKIGEKVIFPIESNCKIDLPIRREYR